MEQPAGHVILAVLADILGRHRRLCCVFGILGSGPSELLVHNAKTSRQLVAVRVVVADQECRLAVFGDELGDVHGCRAVVVVVGERLQRWGCGSCGGASIGELSASLAKPIGISGHGAPINFSTYHRHWARHRHARHSPCPLASVA